MDRVRLLVLAVLVSSYAPGAAASTVREWVRLVDEAAIAAGVVIPKNEAWTLMQDAKVALTTAGVMDEEIVQFVERYTRPDAVAIARRSQRRFVPDVGPSVTNVKRIFAILPDAVKLQQPLNGVVHELQTAETTASMEWDREVLWRLERKYGPGSAKLNAVEVLGAYLLQGTKGFGIDSATGYPGSLEAVLAYSVSYLTYSDEQARMVSAAEFGVRKYIFKRDWGSSSGRLAWLKPAFMSFGVAVAGESDEPLSSPFQGSQRVGAFFGWGDLKVAYLTGENKRFMVTQQFQLIPWVF